MPQPRRVAFMLDLDWPFKRHTGIFTGAQQYAEERGWDTMIDEFVADTLSARRHKQEAPYDGIIARTPKNLVESAKRLNIPVVNVWFSSPVWKSVPGVYPDFAANGRMRAEHLLSRGFRRFAAMITDETRGPMVELNAFAGRLGESGCTCVSAIVPFSPTTSLKEWRQTEKTIVSAMDGWIPPIGVFISDDQTGRIVTQMCRRRGWNVPQDVAIIAGSNELTYCEGLRPTLSSVELGYERVGYAAAKLLDGLMDGEAPPKTPILIPATGLVVRESTDFFAVDDALIAAAMKFIATQFHRPIGAEDVAAAVKTELRTLQRHFRKHLDRTIASEIRRVRIERAKRELSQSNRPIGEIAREVGFGDNLQMYLVFRRDLGVTPSQYRKERRMKDHG